MVRKEKPKKLEKKIKYKTLSIKKYNAMKYHGYIGKGLDGITRGLFLTERGTSSIPVKIRKKRVKSLKSRRRET